MKCPHCLKEFHEYPMSVSIPFTNPQGAVWSATRITCPSCKKDIIMLASSTLLLNFQAWPKGAARPIPPEVPDQCAAEYREACVVLADSAKASAALSRRCLQNLLHDHVGIDKGNLAAEIDELLSRRTLPSQIADAVDAIRQVGNFAAHPIKATATGTITDVEPGEAEWTLDTLDVLFDFYFVQPAKLEEKKKALNAKLVAAGKPPMK